MHRRADYANAHATARRGFPAWKCGITCSPKRRMVWSTSSCVAGPTAHSKIASSMPRASYFSRKRMQSSGVPTQNFVPCSRTSCGVGSPGCGPPAGEALVARVIALIIGRNAGVRPRLQRRGLVARQPRGGARVPAAQPASRGASHCHCGVDHCRRASGANGDRQPGDQRRRWIVAAGPDLMKPTECTAGRRRSTARRRLSTKPGIHRRRGHRPGACMGCGYWPRKIRGSASRRARRRQRRERRQCR